MELEWQYNWFNKSCTRVLLLLDLKNYIHLLYLKIGTVIVNFVILNIYQSLNIIYKWFPKYVTLSSQVCRLFSILAVYFSCFVFPLFNWKNNSWSSILLFFYISADISSALNLFFCFEFALILFSITHFVIFYFISLTKHNPVDKPTSVDHR